MKVIFLIILMVGTVQAVDHSVRLSSTTTVNKGPLFYVNGLIKDWNKKHNQTGDVVVLNIGRRNIYSENVVKVISNDNPVTILDPNQCGLIEPRKAAFIIITLDIFNATYLMKTFQSCVDEVFWASSTNFILLPNVTVNISKMLEIAKFLEAVKRLNNVILHYDNVNGMTRTVSFNFLNRQGIFRNPTVNFDSVFPDKLRNMHKYQYRVAGSSQSTKLRWNDGKFYGKDVLFMETVTKKQNASILITLNNFKTEVIQKEYFKAISDARIDLNLNTINSGGSFPAIQKYFRSFNTYEIDGCCVLVPIPAQKFNFYYMFDPYDWMSWMLMGISLVALAIIWKVFTMQRDSLNLNSAGLMVFLVIAGFLGQGFSFRHTRWFHLMVIEIFIFMVLILGNAYQSLLTSQLTIQKETTRITTIEEMLNGDYNYISDEFYFGTLESYETNIKLTSKLQKDNEIYNYRHFDYEAVASNNSVLLMRCDIAYHLINKKNLDSLLKPSDAYYILPDKLFTLYETLLTTRFSPFVDRFEEFSLRIFESGIRQHWKTLLYNLTGNSDQQISVDNEANMLKLSDLKYVFYIWGIGLMAATVALVFELLCDKYRVKTKKSCIGKAMRIIKMEGRKEEKERKEKMMIRRLRPIIDDETFEMIQCDV